MVVEADVSAGVKGQVWKDTPPGLYWVSIGCGRMPANGTCSRDRYSHMTFLSSLNWTRGMEEVIICVTGDVSVQVSQEDFEMRVRHRTWASGQQS